jgi:predicted dehydrogenase
MYLTRLFLGMPEAVSAQYGYVTGREVEDNAAATLRYASGAVGVVEAGFVNPFSPFSIELHGTEGSLFYGTPEAKLLLRSSRLGEKQWTLRDIPPNRESAFRQWVKHIRDNTVAEENIAIALDLTRLMEASNRSAASGRSVRIDELAVR